ncbi:leucine-rich repeat-containing protein 72 isoform X1 [Gasterosteus aculeatus]
MEKVEDIKESQPAAGRRDVDVDQLNLSKKKLTRLPDLSRFHFLRELWLNNNKISELSGRSLNCCLTELYLQNNNIPSISGALKHLTCLRVLLLHNNRLRGLEDTTKELRRMQQLHTATFFLNPISHEAEYRLHVIHRLPSIQVLDGEGEISGTRVGKPPAARSICPTVACVTPPGVESAERRRSFQMFNRERHRVLQSVAFGRRAAG